LNRRKKTSCYNR